MIRRLGIFMVDSRLRLNEGGRPAGVEINNDALRKGQMHAQWYGKFIWKAREPVGGSRGGTQVYRAGQ
jgi:hypothetical protein